MAKIERRKAVQVAKCAKAIDCQNKQAGEDGSYISVTVVCAKANHIWHGFCDSVHCPLRSANYFGLTRPHLKLAAQGVFL